MTIRHKITLLITAAGVLSSLVFSCFILWEMLERPFHLNHIDAELETEAAKAVRIVSGNMPGKTLDEELGLHKKHDWMVIYDHDSGREIYRSFLAGLVKVPEPAPGLSLTSNLTIPQPETSSGHKRRGDLTLRIKSFKIPYNGKTFLVTAGRQVEQLEKELEDTVIGVAGGLAFSILLLLAISYFFAGFILKPIKVMNEQARDISERHLDRRLPVTVSRDEFNALARTLNRVFDRLQHAFLRQKRLIADASHELKTPLTMMRLALDERRSDIGHGDNDPQAKSIQQLTEQVLRMERLIKSLLDLSSLEIEAAVKKDPINLADILNALIADYRFLAEPRNIRVDTTLPERIEVKGDADKLNRAFSNVIDNAIKYNIDGGQIIIIGDQSEDGSTITINNTGPGVPETEIPKVFDQFYRVDQSRALQHGGSGLGLAIVKRIVELHGGKVKFDSQLKGWTRVTISLPV